MFILLRRIRAWKADMLSRGVFSTAEVAELEDHLMEESSRLAESGMADLDAFLEASRRMGTDMELGDEYTHYHELSGASAGVLVARSLRVSLLVCRFLRGVLIVCLPGAVLCIPWLLISREFSLESMSGDTYGLATTAGNRAAAVALPLLLAHGWWLLPLCLLIVVGPAIQRIRHLRDTTGLDTGSIVAEEIVAVRPLLITGILVYPLLGMGLAHILFSPLFTLTQMLGG